MSRGSRKKSTMTSNRYKLVVVGDGACGKTSLLTVFKDGVFPTEHIPTVFETDIAKMEIEGEEGEIELALWDTAGQEEYDKLRPLSYPNTDVVLICFSVDSPKTLYHVEKQWCSEVRHFCRGVPVILVGNKTDLRDDEATVRSLSEAGQAPVTRDQTRATAGRVRAEAFVECSSLRNEGVDEVFRCAARAAVQRRKANNSRMPKIPGCALL